MKSHKQFNKPVIQSPAETNPGLALPQNNEMLYPAESHLAIDRLSSKSRLLFTPSFWGVFVSTVTLMVWLGGWVYGFQTALVVQIVFSFILSVLGLAIPAAGVIGIGMLAGINAMAAEYVFTGGLLRFNTLNYWLLLVMIFALPLVVRLKDLSTRLLLVFIFVLGIGLIYSQNRLEGLDDVLNITTTFGLVFYFARGLKDESSFYWLGITNGLLGALVGMLFFIQFNELPYSNPNNWTYIQLASLFSICIGLYYANMLKKNKIFLLFLAVVNFAWVFLSGSRGSLLIALICVGFIFFSNRSFTLNTLLLGLIVLVGIWVSTRFIEQQVATIGRIQLLFNTNVGESTRTSQRSEIFQAGIKLFQESPLGIGTGSFREASQQTGYVQSRRPAHSGWIKTLVENGVQGVMLLAAFIISFTLAGLRNRDHGNLTLGIFISLVFSVAFIAKEFQEKSLWLLAALGIVILNAAYIKFLMQSPAKHLPEHRRRLGEIRLSGK